MKLRPHKGGHGHVTSYDVTIGSAEAKAAGFVTEDGTRREVEKVIDKDAGTILIKVKEEEQK